MKLGSAVRKVMCLADKEIADKPMIPMTRQQEEDMAKSGEGY